MTTELKIATMTEHDLSGIVRQAVEAYIEARRNGSIATEGEDGRPQLLLTYKQASESMNLSADTLRRLALRGEIPVVRIGKSARIPARWLEGWIEEQTRIAQAESQDMIDSARRRERMLGGSRR